MIESGEIYKLIVENVNNLVAVINEDQIFEYINENVHEKLTGYSNEDLMDKEVLSFIHLEDHKKILYEFDNSLKTGINFTEFRFKHKEGHYIWIETNGKRFVDKDGRFKILTISRDITERKVAEEKLKYSEEKYRIISENAYDLIIVLNQKFKYEYINESAFQQILGYSKEDLLGKLALKYAHPDDVSNTTRILFEGFKRGRGEAEFRLKHKDGHWLWFEGKGKTFSYNDGDLKAIIISRDITERKKAEEKLKKSEFKLQERVKELSSIYKLSKLIENPNTNIENIFQGTLALIPSAFQFPDIVCARILYKNKIYSTINFEITDWKFSTKGMINQNEMIIEIYYLEEKAFTKGEHDLIGDFFLRLKSCIEEREAKKKLKESEEKYRIISETAYDLIIVLNQKFKYEYINENAYQQILGYSKEDLLGKSALKYVHPDDVSNTTRILYNGFKRGKGEAEFRFKHKDGHWLWLEGKGKTFPDNDGDLKAIIISRDITERKLAEQKLKESEEKYRDLVNRIPDLLLEVDLKGKFTYASPQLYDIFGFTPSEIQNKRIHRFIHPDDMFKVVEALKKGFDTRKSITVEYRTLHKDGHYVHASAKGSLLENGRFYGVVRDISERKLMEQKLEESEEKYRLISESANDLIRVLNEKFEFEYINENVHKRLLGYTKEDLLGQTPLPFHHPKDYRHIIRSTVRNLKKGEGSYQARVKDKNGNYKWFEFAGKYFFDSKGKKKILSIARDINERKLAQEELESSYKKLRELEYIINRSNGIAFLWHNSENWPVEYVSENIKQFGYTPEDFYSGKVNYDEIIHPDDATRVTEEISNHSNENTNEFIQEYRIKTRTGQIRWVDDRTWIRRNTEGNITHFQGIVLDITDRKIAEEALKLSENKYRKAYNRANFYKDIFGHDINNILHIISSSAELISYHLGGSEKSKVIEDISNIIKNQVERGAKLVANISILSQLEEEDMQTQPTDVCKLMRNSIDFVNKAYIGRGIKIEDVCEKDHLTANANELLQDVFDNILINSIKYNENPKIEIVIKASKTLVDKKKFIKMEFSDNGIGVPDDRKEIVFKRGNRELKGSKGMGIGLSLVKKIMKGYNGKIWVEDKVKGDFSKGSNFILLIPEIV